MVWLDVAGENGCGLYFEIIGMEPRREKGGSILAVTGLVGDGHYEGQVLIEEGHQVSVTFVDEWLGAGDLHDFFANVDRQVVERALKEVLAGMSLEEKVHSITDEVLPLFASRSENPHQPPSRPHPYRKPKEDPVRVISEEIEAW